MTRVTKPSAKMVTPSLASLSIVSEALPTGIAHRSNSFLSRFNSDKRGSTAIIFGLMVAPIMMMTGMAVDYSRMITVKARMQTALDAAALAGARATKGQSANLSTLAQNAASTYFNAIAMPFVATKTLSAVTTDVSQTVFTWTATSWVKTPFMSVGGFIKPQAAPADAPAGCTSSFWVCQKVMTKASTTVQIGGVNIETSFMLDITGSMAGQKIADLKAAANDAIDILIWPDQSKYTSRVAITPFAQDVRLPTPLAFLKATGAAAANVTGVGTYNNKGFHKFTTELCVAERTGVNKYTDAAPGVGNGFVMSAMLWDGWQVDPNNPLINPSCDVPSGAVATPLTTDKVQLHNLITALTPSGGTAGHLGTAWAWYMLSPNWNSLWAPVNQAAPFDNAYNINTKVGDPSLQRLKKIAILMTDGDYNQEYASTGKMTYFGGSPANASSSTQSTELCKSMKAQGIEVYTVAFGDGLSSTAQTLLTNCATDPSHFYNAVTGDALKAAFRDIALKISSLRITQ